LRKHGLAEPIVFDDYYNPEKVALATGTVVVLDSVNPKNNVTSIWTDNTRRQFLDRVQDAYDATVAAWSAERDGDEDEAVEHWCEVFGDACRNSTSESRRVFTRRSPTCWKKTRAYPPGSVAMNTPGPISGCETPWPAVHSGDPLDMVSPDLLGAGHNKLIGP
jgi:hypothetical protein